MFRHALVLIVILTVAYQAAAADRTSPYWLQGDISGGFQRIKPDKENEIAKDGMLAGARLLGEYRTNYFGAFGVGVGVQQTWQDGETETRVQRYILRSLVVDGSYLYPFASEFFWLGWLVRTQTGKGGKFEFTDIESFQTLVTTGPQLRFNFARKNFDWVVGASALTDVNSPDRSIVNFPVYIGVSIPIGKGRVVATAASAPEPIKVAPIQAEPVRAAPVAVSFDSRLIPFDLNKAILKPESTVFLDKLTVILKEQSENWKALVISGHTDTIGKASRNQILSQERAAAVREYLMRRGIPAERITAIGYGSQRLLPDLDSNSARHRRVEILFEGVSDGMKINDAMSTLKSGH
ncbi:MAG: OmpA family protein [Bdellovibrionales bacterium]|nr:OmpA family protein [Bdellovibrionales bacterium]